MDKREFYKTIITFEVLSEEPVLGHSLEFILRECEEGSYVGRHGKSTDSLLNGAAMAEALTEFDSEPAFFQLTPEGDAGCDRCGVNDRAEGYDECQDCIEEITRRDVKNGLYG